MKTSGRWPTTRELQSRFESLGRDLFIRAFSEKIREIVPSDKHIKVGRLALTIESPEYLPESFVREKSLSPEVLGFRAAVKEDALAQYYEKNIWQGNQARYDRALKAAQEFGELTLSEIIYPSTVPVEGVITAYFARNGVLAGTRYTLATQPNPTKQNLLAANAMIEEVQGHLRNGTAADLLKWEITA